MSATTKTKMTPEELKDRAKPATRGYVQIENARLQRKLDKSAERQERQRESDNKRHEFNRKQALGRHDMLAGTVHEIHEPKLAEHDEKLSELKAKDEDHEVRITRLENAPKPAMPAPAPLPQPVPVPVPVPPQPAPPEPVRQDPPAAPTAPKRNRVKEATAWLKPRFGHFVLMALAVIAGLIALALIVLFVMFMFGIAVWGWNLIPSPESHDSVASGSNPVSAPPATTVTVAPPTSTAPPTTTTSPTTTNPPPPPPDDGTVEVLGPTMIRITLGTTTWSEEVDTGESDPMVYSFSGANNAKLPDTVLVMFMDNGLTGKANAEDNPNESWDPELSPMKFQGPAGTVIYITW